MNYNVDVTRVLIASIPVGTMAALLTAIEYLLSLVCSLSARASVHGLWLIGLHRGGEAKLTGTTYVRRGFIRSMLVTLIGVWLVIGIALVESNLQVGVLVKPNAVNSTLCVSIYGKYMPKRSAIHKPPYRAFIEPWIMQVSRKIECGHHGIATVGTGGLSDPYGTIHNMSSPVCSKQALDVKGGEVVASLKMLKMRELSFHPVWGESGGFALFPHDGSKIGKSILQPVEGTGPCSEVGISGYLTALESFYETLHFQVQNVTRTVHESICTLHAKKPVVPLPDDVVASCIMQKKDKLDSSCLRNQATPALLNRIRLANVSALFIGEQIGAPSYACLSTTVEYEYVFIGPKFVKRGDRNAVVNLPVLVPTLVKALHGHCERTIAPLGQAALVYSADDEWSKGALAKMTRKHRFYAYTMAVSASMFPLHNLRGSEDPSDNGTCLLRPVTGVTEIPMDWRFGIMLSGLCIVFLIVIIGIALRMSFSGDVWKVGSPQWSLARLVGNNGDDGEKKVLIQVLPVEPADPLPAPSESSNLGGRMSPRALIRPTSPGGGWGRMAPFPERQFQYRVHTVSSAQKPRPDSHDPSTDFVR